MNVKAIMTVGIEEYELLHLHFTVEQSTDHKMQPQHEVHGGLFDVEIAQQVSPAIYKWMTQNWEQKDGKIDFKDEGGQIMNTISFTNAYCVQYNQRVSARGRESMITQLTITAGKIQQQGIELDNNWIKS